MGADETNVPDIVPRRSERPLLALLDGGDKAGKLTLAALVRRRAADGAAGVEVLIVVAGVKMAARVVRRCR